MTDIVGGGMSDKPPLSNIVDLRTRIAGAIAGVDDWPGVTDPAISADAVIAELGLAKMRRATGWMEDGKLCYRSCYRTEWEADDE
jgi:hypothetical protein